METPQQETGPWDARRMRQLDLLLWQISVSHSSFKFDDFVYHTPRLADLVGEAEYVRLVEDCIQCELGSGLRGADFQPVIDRFHNRLFPRACQCRAPPDIPRSITFHAFEDFDLVHLRLDFSDETLTKTMRVLFHRTPDIDLLRCEICGDLWVRNLDQIYWDQHLVLLEPDYDGKYQPWVKWVNLFNVMEDYAAKNFGIVTTQSPDLRDWQKAHNTPESFALYADP